MDSWNKVGYEILFRSDRYHSPEQAFQLAEQENVLYELETASIHKAIQQFRMTYTSYSPYQLFINVYPTTIMNPMFPDFLTCISDLYDAKNIVFEIIESEQIVDMESFKETILAIRELRFGIAIDDLGKGTSEFKKIIELKPDVIKLDMYFAKNINKSSEKQFIIKSIKEYCKEFNIKLTLEGLEYPVEVATAKLLEIDYGQGYLLGRPQLLISNMARL